MILVTCKNHRNLRWMRKPPEDIGRSLFFCGEVTEDGLRKEHGLDMLPPVSHLKSRLAGRNPYAPDREDLAEPDRAIKTWEDVLEFVAYIEHNRKRFAVECECPLGALEIMRGEDGGYVNADEWSKLPEFPWREVTE